MLDVSYIGNRGTRLNHHFQTLGVDANMNDPSVLALGHERPAVEHQLRRSRSSAGIPSPYPGFNGNVAQALRQYPAVPEDPVARRPDRREPVPRAGARARAALLAAACRRASATPTRKLNNNGAESAQGVEGINGAVQNPADPLEWQLSADDTPHVFLTGFTWEIPGTRRWTVAGREDAAGAAGTSAGSCATRAAGRSTSR